MRIAADSEGYIYVTNAYYNSVDKLTNNGLPVFGFHVRKPLGIAVDGAGRLFVGSADDGSVTAYDQGGAALFKLGSGEGEFGMPNDIAISGAGVVYVTDSLANLVKAYDLSGAALFSFGSNFRYPTGIAVDDLQGEVYVSDHKNIYIKVFDLNGVYKRGISGRGSIWSGGDKLLSPQGLAVDETRFYVADSYHSVVAVYSKGGTFLGYIGNYGPGPGEFRTPMDVVFDGDGKLFVTNSENQRVEAIGIDSYALLSVSPTRIGFSTFEGGQPLSAEVGIWSHVPEAWTASPGEVWASVSPATGTAPGAALVTVDPAGLPPGDHSCLVSFKTGSGTAYPVRVDLEVKPSPASLSVAPSGIDFKYQLGSGSYPSANIIITSTGRELSWTASTPAPWLGLGGTYGKTPSTLEAALNGNADSLPPGDYNSSIEIDAGGVPGSPARVAVSLRVVYAGTVTVRSNLDSASFVLDGPASYTGAGAFWSSDEVMPGEYTLSFGHVQGYLKPYTRRISVETGRQVEVFAEYREKPAATNIVAGSGALKDQGVKVLTTDGSYVVSSFVPPIRYGTSGIEAATGDLDGDGADEIAVKSGNSAIIIYAPDGTALSALSAPPEFLNTAFALGDMDGDSVEELFVAFQQPRYFAGQGTMSSIKAYGYSGGSLNEKGTIYEWAGGVSSGISIALGDTDGDGEAELLVADGQSLGAYDIAPGPEAVRLWAVAHGLSETPRLSTGDLDGDGVYEVVLGALPADSVKKSGVVRVFRGDGEPYGLEFEPFGDLGFRGAPGVSLGDLDGDGEDEIAAGSAIDTQNSPLIRLFESDGGFTGVTIRPMDGKGGVNVSLGSF